MYCWATMKVTSWGRIRRRLKGRMTWKSLTIILGGEADAPTTEAPTTMAPAPPPPSPPNCTEVAVVMWSWVKAVGRGSGALRCVAHVRLVVGGGEGAFLHRAPRHSFFPGPSLCSCC